LRQRISAARIQRSTGNTSAITSVASKLRLSTSNQKVVRAMAKRRGQREGSIFQRRDGRWCGVINVGWQGGKRRRKYVYGVTEADVVDRMADERKNAKDGTLVLDERQTVGDFLNRWLQDCAAPKVQPTTLRRYQDLIRLHIVPEIGRVPLAKLTP